MTDKKKNDGGRLIFQTPAGDSYSVLQLVCFAEVSCEYVDVFLQPNTAPSQHTFLLYLIKVTRGLQGAPVRELTVGGECVGACGGECGVTRREGSADDGLGAKCWFVNSGKWIQ